MKKIEELAEIVQGKVVGDKDILISGINNLENAKEGEISFILDAKKVEDAKKSLASAFLVAKEIPQINKPQIISENVKLSYAKILNVFFKREPHKEEIHPLACVSKSAKIGKNVSIGAFCFIDEEVQIKDNVRIFPNVFIGKKVIIGENSTIYPMVTIRENCIIGKNVIIHPGVVIGADGFGYVKDENDRHFKIQQIGNVVVEDDVEIGANTCVDRATFGTTRIGKGTKIDNLVQIGHNVEIGENCIIVSQVGISGSVKIGARCILAGQVGIKDHVNIGDDSVILGKAGVVKDVPPKSIYYGMPAGPHIEQKRLEVLIKKLPELFEKIKGAQK